MAEIFHTLNRGVDKRKIFIDNQDYLRFIHDLFEFNDQNITTNVLYRFRNSMDIASPYIKTTKNIGRKSERNPRKLLVDIYAFCLMPNHYHLLLSPRTEGAITKFMKKINIGYAKYFNQKYERKGTLFEGRYKSVNIKDESHFVHIPYYIHLNPLDLAAPEWRERKLKNYKEATRFLEKYRWSSHLDYLGKKNFPSVTNRELLMKFFGGPKEYEKSIKQWLKDIELDDIRDIVLE